VKHTTADALLSRELLCFVRDHAPSADEFTARFGGPGGQAFHVLRKAGVLEVEDGRVRLNGRHLSPDGERFNWGCRVFLLDRDEVLLVRWGPERAPDADTHSPPLRPGFGI
jgi:hypothetical protein